MSAFSARGIDCCTGLVLLWHAVDHAAHFSDVACKPGLPVCQFSLWLLIRLLDLVGSLEGITRAPAG